jgi:protein phosphatase
VVIAALAIFFAVRIYLDRQWYVGESNGNVAVYQGIPATLGGVHFSHVELETDIPASEVATLPQYPALSEGITANDRTEAMGIVEQIRQDLAAATASS